MLIKLVKWLLFSVLVALAPIVGGWLIQATRANTPPVFDLISHGELLLIAVALSSAAGGELIGTGESMKLYKMFAAGISALIVIVAALYFSNVSASIAAGEALNVLFLERASIVIYISAIISSASCIALSEV